MLENEGREKNITYIKENTPALLEKYRGYQSILQPYCQDENEPQVSKKTCSLPTLNGLFSAAREALDNLDLDQMEDIVTELSQYEFPKDQQTLCTQLNNAVDVLDADACENIIATWEQLLK